METNNCGLTECCFILPFSIVILHQTAGLRAVSGFHKEIWLNKVKCLFMTDLVILGVTCLSERCIWMLQTFF